MNEQARFLLLWILWPSEGTLTITLPSLQEGDSDENSLHYAVVPFLSGLIGGVEYFDIYITSQVDAKVDLSIQGAAFYWSVLLTEKNDWSWHAQFPVEPHVEHPMMTNTLQIVASHDVNILLTENAKALTYTALPLKQHRQFTKYIFGHSRWCLVDSWPVPAFRLATDDKSVVVSIHSEEELILADLAFDEHRIYDLPVDYFHSRLDFDCSDSVALYWTYVNEGEPRVFSQIPAVDELGTRYVVGPQAGEWLASRYSVFVLPYDRHSLFKILHPTYSFRVSRESSDCFCQYDNSSEGCTMFCRHPTPSGFIEVELINADEAMVVECPGACLVYVSGRSGDPHVDPGYVALVAPPRMHPGGVHFFIPSVQAESSAEHAWTNIALPSEAVDGLRVDNVNIKDLGPLLKYRATVVSTWTVLTLDLNPGNHRISHRLPDVTAISVNVYGIVVPLYSSTDRVKIFGYPAVYRELRQNNGTQSTLDAAKRQDRIAVAMLILLSLLFIIALGSVFVQIRHSVLLRAIYVKKWLVIMKSKETKETHQTERSITTDERHKEDHEEDIYLMPLSPKPVNRDTGYSGQ